MWVYRSSWRNETGRVVGRAVRYQGVDKKGAPIYHKSHFADDSGNFFFFYSPFIKWFSSLDVQKLKSVKIVSKRKILARGKYGVSLSPPAAKGPATVSHLLRLFLCLKLTVNTSSGIPMTSMMPRKNGSGIRGDSGEQGITFRPPHNRETCNRRLQRGGNRPQTQLRDMLTGLFNTKRRLFFFPPETAEAFLERRAARLSSVAAFKVREIRKMKNEAVVRPRTRVRKSRRAIFYNEAYLDFFLSKSLVFMVPHGSGYSRVPYSYT